jgi:opacity protein-like surface antigen
VKFNVYHIQSRFVRRLKMTRSGFLKGVVFLLLFAGLSAAAWSQVTISGGLALSVVNGEESYNGGSTYKVDGKMGIGGNVYVDYLLPIGIPLSLGFEIGIDGAALDGPEAGYDSGDIKITAIPLLLRAAYHFDLHPQLDLYVVGKIGYALGSGEIGNEKEDGFNGLGFGVDLGAAFYFMPRFGLFAEGGIDVYNLSKDFSGSYDDGYSTTSYNVTTKLPFYRFLTIGLSTKF